jgi:hypothetical protein
MFLLIDCRAFWSGCDTTARIARLSGARLLTHWTKLVLSGRLLQMNSISPT